jgi:hypothetical protein
VTWPLSDSEIEIGEWSVADLQVGDLVFGQKHEGPLAWLCDQADEPWRHVGSLIEVDGELKVVEIRGDNFLLNPIDHFFAAGRYAAWGAVRLRMRPECVASANEWMMDHLQGGEKAAQVYAWDDLVLAGIISASRRGLVGKDPERVKAAIDAASRRCKESLEHRGNVSLTCSSFIQLAYEHAGGPCAIEHRVWRGEPVSWPERSPQIDALFNMTEEELAGFHDASLLDLYLEAEEVDRGTSTTKARPGHVLEMVKVLSAAVCGYAFGEAPPDGLAHDSRWVTPGDLWRSPSVYERAFVFPD